ncbi:hypothetical protein BRD19_00440, partial [Halobacteriales archaeon SW_7_65_23]
PLDAAGPALSTALAAEPRDRYPTAYAFKLAVLFDAGGPTDEAIPAAIGVGSAGAAATGAGRGEARPADQLETRASGGEPPDADPDPGSETPADGSPLWGRQDLGAAVDDALVVANGSVYLVDRNSRIRALSTANGRERWTYDADDELQGPPIVADGSLYVVGDEYSLHALTDPSTE